MLPTVEQQRDEFPRFIFYGGLNLFGEGIQQMAHKRKRESFHILFQPGNLLVTLTLERISQAHE